MPKPKNPSISSDYKAGGIAIICADDLDEKLPIPHAPTSCNHGRTERASSSPACCRGRSEYPSGYTMFECRLDGNQPIAQVVQVPPDTSEAETSRNKTCMILETRQSEFGPTSRVAAYPGQRNARSASPGPMSFALESRDFPGGAVSYAEKVAARVNSALSQPITTLEATKGASSQDGPSSRLTYGPVSNVAGRTRSRSYKPPAFYIQCSTTPGRSVARVTQFPQDVHKSAGDTRYEAFAKRDGSCPIATIFQSNENNATNVQEVCEYLETSVCPSGPRARALTLPDGSSDVRHFTHLNVKPRENGPSARISQHPGDARKIGLNLPDDQRSKKITACCCQPISEPNYEGRKSANRGAPIEGRRNGLDSTASQLGCHAGAFNYGGIKKQKISQAKKHCSPSSRALPKWRAQPTACAIKQVQAPEKSLKSATFQPPRCPCPLQSPPNGVERSCLEKHPLPGGCVVSQRPIGFLPDIAPVELGPNRLRYYESKTKEPRKAASSKKQKPTAERKSNKPARSSQQETTRKIQSKKAKSREKHEKTPAIPQAEKDQDLPDLSSKTNVECPAFASKGSQSDPIRQEPVYVQCPDYETRPKQSEHDVKHRDETRRKDHGKEHHKVPSSSGKKEIGHREKHDKSAKQGSPHAGKTTHGLKAVNSRELRAGVVYYDCDCYHRNGLQQDCPRGGCGGLMRCVEKPWPRCNLSRYYKKKWGTYGDLLDLIPPSTYCGPRDALYRAKLGKIDRLKIENIGMRTDEHSGREPDGKSGKQGDDHGSERSHSSRSYRTTHDGKCRKVHDNMVQQYAIIPITVANNEKSAK